MRPTGPDLVDLGGAPPITAASNVTFRGRAVESGKHLGCVPRGWPAGRSLSPHRSQCGVGLRVLAHL